MATVTPQHLSGSTDGKAISITATTSGTAQTIHTAVSGTTSFDEVTIYCFNRDTTTFTLHLSFGDTALEAIVQIPANVGLVPVAFGEILNNGQIVKAWADTTAKLALIGRVQRYVP